MNTSGGVSFKLVLKKKSAEEAEEHCKGCCGHLAAYTSQQEQGDVEGFYINGGCCVE